jgi:guanylate kinase
MKLILVGKAAAGKDFLKTRLSSKGFTSGISHTTRSPRENENHGKDYYFIDDTTFEKMIEHGDFVEYMKFNGWYYGQTKKDFDKADVMIMSKDGLDILPKKYRDQCIVIYLDPPRIDRVDRLQQRNDINDSIIRRMNTDDEQFKEFRDFDIRIRNADF